MPFSVKNKRIYCENNKYVLDENFHGHFCPRGKAAKFCHPDAQEYLENGHIRIGTGRT